MSRLSITVSVGEVTANNKTSRVTFTSEPIKESEEVVGQIVVNITFPNRDTALDFKSGEYELVLQKKA